MASKKKDELRLVYSSEGVQEADDGDTTRYGGTWTLDGKEYRGYGDDRSDSWKDDVTEEVVKACKQKWPRTYRAFRKDDFQEALRGIVENGPEDGPYDAFTFVVTKPKDGFATVRGEPTPKAPLKEKAKPAQEVGDLLGDLLAEHLGENEDWLAQALADNGLPGSLKATERNLAVIVEEAMKYVKLAIAPIARKALTKDQDLG